MSETKSGVTTDRGSTIPQSSCPDCNGKGYNDKQKWSLWSGYECKTCKGSGMRVANSRELPCNMKKESNPPRSSEPHIESRKQNKFGCGIIVFVVVLILMIIGYISDQSGGDSGYTASSPREFGYGLFSLVLDEVSARQQINPTTALYFINKCKADNKTVKSYTKEELAEFENGVWAAYEDNINENPMKVFEY